MHGSRGRSDRRKRSSATIAVAVLTLIVGLFALTAGAALAASGGKATSAGDQYKGVIVVKPAVAKQTKPTTQPKQTSGVSNVASVKTSSSGLPFTGISLAGTAVLGIGLVGLGVMLRRRGQHDES